MEFQRFPADAGIFPAILPDIPPGSPGKILHKVRLHLALLQQRKY
jgi:hypothetical protein